MPTWDKAIDFLKKWAHGTKSSLISHHSDKNTDFYKHSTHRVVVFIKNNKPGANEPSILSVIVLISPIMFWTLTTIQTGCYALYKYYIIWFTIGFM